MGDLAELSGLSGLVLCCGLALSLHGEQPQVKCAELGCAAMPCGSVLTLPPKACECTTSPDVSRRSRISSCRVNDGPERREEFDAFEQGHQFTSYTLEIGSLTQA